MQCTSEHRRKIKIKRKKQHFVCAFISQDDTVKGAVPLLFMCAQKQSEPVHRGKPLLNTEGPERLTSCNIIRTARKKVGGGLRMISEMVQC